MAERGKPKEPPERTIRTTSRTTTTTTDRGVEKHGELHSYLEATSLPNSPRIFHRRLKGVRSLPCGVDVDESDKDYDLSPKQSPRDLGDSPKCSPSDMRIFGDSPKSSPGYFSVESYSPACSLRGLGAMGDSTGDLGILGDSPKSSPRGLEDSPICQQRGVGEDLPLIPRPPKTPSPRISPRGTGDSMESRMKTILSTNSEAAAEESPRIRRRKLKHLPSGLVKRNSAPNLHRPGTPVARTRTNSAGSNVTTRNTDQSADSEDDIAELADRLSAIPSGDYRKTTGLYKPLSNNTTRNHRRVKSALGGVTGSEQSKPMGNAVKDDACAKNAVQLGSARTAVTALVDTPGVLNSDALVKSAVGSSPGSHSGNGETEAFIHNAAEDSAAHTPTSLTSSTGFHQSSTSAKWDAQMKAAMRSSFGPATGHCKSPSNNPKTCFVQMEVRVSSGPNPGDVLEEELSFQRHLSARRVSRISEEDLNLEHLSSLLERSRDRGSDDDSSESDAGSRVFNWLREMDRGGQDFDEQLPAHLPNIGFSGGTF